MKRLGNDHNLIIIMGGPQEKRNTNKYDIIIITGFEVGFVANNKYESTYTRKEREIMQRNLLKKIIISLGLQE